MSECRLESSVNAERSCELCGGRSHVPLYEVEGFPIVRCRRCGLVFVGRVPSPDELLALYDSSYWEAEDEPGYAGYLEAEERKRHHFRGQLKEIEALIPRGDLLEIGSAYGYFLDEARSRGWRVRGVEPSEHAAARARDKLGLEVAPGPFAAMPPEPESIDVIALWDVIEHLPDPRRTLEAARAWLRPGGVVALSTGDFGSLAARIHGRDWSLLTPPWHQFYFSKCTLRALLQSLGFRVVKVRGDGLLAVDPCSARPRVPGPVARALRAPFVVKVARRLGSGMIITFFARKAGS